MSEGCYPTIYRAQKEEPQRQKTLRQDAGLLEKTAKMAVWPEQREKGERK